MSDNASGLIYAASIGDCLSINREKIDVVAVTGNSMGWYSALACGGAVTPADMDMAVRAIVFSAVGTAGQRCTTLPRLIVHNSVRADLVQKLAKAYASLPVGDPRNAETLVDPLIDQQTLDAMQSALAAAKAQGCTVHGGGAVKFGAGGAYAAPAIADMPEQTDIMRKETFAPILYVVGYDTFEEAMDLHNSVPQGLSSCIFTMDMREAETFMSATGPRRSTPMTYAPQQNSRSV